MVMPSNEPVQLGSLQADSIQIAEYIHQTFLQLNQASLIDSSQSHNHLHFNFPNFSMSIRHLSQGVLNWCCQIFLCRSIWHLQLNALFIVTDLDGGPLIMGHTGEGFNLFFFQMLHYYLLAIMIVLAFPPKESFNNQVSTESLYGMNTVKFTFFLVAAFSEQSAVMRQRLNKDSLSKS